MKASSYPSMSSTCPLPSASLSPMCAWHSRSTSSRSRGKAFIGSALVVIILWSSSDTMSHALRHAGSRLLIRALQIDSNATSGVKRPERVPLQLRIAKAMRDRRSASSSSILATSKGNNSVKTRLIRAPPDSSVRETDPAPPSIASCTSFPNAFTNLTRFFVAWPIPDSFCLASLAAFSRSCTCFSRVLRRVGSVVLMWLVSCWLSFCWRNGVPILVAIERYFGCLVKNSFSDASAVLMSLLPSMSFCERLTTPTYPRRSGRNSLERISMASVPSSIRSSLVMTPMVRIPSGSTDLASLSASELARSELAGDTARMMQLSL
mmetsp:Transcript_26895/g.70657  ORF Transcript_26895/g.70657 Transcript_26895/m.70657 type:complete len:321 (+) Transcript_26895:910-1872(+)